MFYSSIWWVVCLCEVGWECVSCLGMWEGVVEFVCVCCCVVLCFVVLCRVVSCRVCVFGNACLWLHRDCEFSNISDPFANDTSDPFACDIIDSFACSLAASVNLWLTTSATRSLVTSATLSLAHEANTASAPKTPPKMPPHSLPQFGIGHHCQRVVLSTTFWRYPHCLPLFSECRSIVTFGVGG